MVPTIGFLKILLFHFWIIFDPKWEIETTPCKCIYPLCSENPDWSMP